MRGWSTPRAGCSPVDASSAPSSADASAKDDAARDLLVTIDEEWFAFLARAVRESADAVPGVAADPTVAETLAFEITALLDAANLTSLLHRTSRGYAMARAGIRQRLIASGPNRAPSAGS